MKLARTLLAIVFLLTGFTSQAQTQPAAPLDVRATLINGQFDLLERHFGQLQRNYVGGRISDEDLRASLRVLRDTKLPLEEAYTRWVAQYPMSYVAHLARGTFYAYLGNERRGDQFASQTTAEQFAGMRAAHLIAKQELVLSLKLDRKPIMSYVQMIALAQFEGDPESRRQLLDRGLALDPKTFILREMYLLTLRSRWGGSPEEMREFVDESRRAGLTQNQMARLNSLVFEDEGWVEQYRGGDKDKAIKKYRQALMLDPQRDCDECGPTYQIVYLLQSQQKHAEVVQMATKHLEAHPDAVEMLTRRAFSYLAMDKRREGIADYLLAAEMGDAHAQMAAAKALMTGDGGLTKDFNRANDLMRRAAQQGDPEALEWFPARTPRPPPMPPDDPKDLDRKR